MPEERSLYLFASVLSAAIFGVEVCPVQVEADVRNGLPSFIMVGFPSAQVKEAQERVRTALKNNGCLLYTSMRIQMEGRQKRQAAEMEMHRMEEELKRKLLEIR